MGGLAVGAPQVQHPTHQAELTASRSSRTVEPPRIGQRRAAYRRIGAHNRSPIGASDGTQIIRFRVCRPHANRPRPTALVPQILYAQKAGLRQARVVVPEFRERRRRIRCGNRQVTYETARGSIWCSPLSLVAATARFGRHPEIEAHGCPHAPYGVLDRGVEGVPDSPPLSTPSRRGLGQPGSTHRELLDPSVSISKLVIYRNGFSEYRVGRDHLRIPVVSQERLPDAFQFIEITAIEETVLESPPEIPCGCMKRGVILATIEQRGRPPRLFAVFQPLLSSVSLCDQRRGECPHDTNNGDHESCNVSAQHISARSACSTPARDLSYLRAEQRIATLRYLWADQTQTG